MGVFGPGKRRRAKLLAGQTGWRPQGALARTLAAVELWRRRGAKGLSSQVAQRQSLLLARRTASTQADVRLGFYRPGGLLLALGLSQMAGVLAIGRQLSHHGHDPSHGDQAFGNLGVL